MNLEEVERNIRAIQALWRHMSIRERAVLDMGMEGHSVQQMANELGVSHTRVRQIKANIRWKARDIFIRGYRPPPSGYPWWTR